MVAPARACPRARLPLDGVVALFTLVTRWRPVPRLVRLTVSVVALAALITASTWSLGERPPARDSPSPGTVGTPLDDDPETGVSTTTTVRNISFWQQRLRTDPRDYIAETMLGGAWAQRARETGDVGDFQRAEQSLRGALAVNPRYSAARGALAGVLFAEHEFTEALQLADAVAASQPGPTQAYAVAADARLELGQVDQAAAAYQRLAEQAPSSPVYSRLARLAFLRGDTATARSWAREAVTAAADGGAGPETRAWYRVQLGDLDFAVGDLDGAQANYQAALTDFHGYYLATAGLAKVSAAQGDLTAAAQRYRRAVAVVPRPDLLAALGDVLAAQGRRREADDQYATVEYIGTLAKINRQVYNRQLALFYADHHRQPTEALKLAQNELAVRTDIYGWDAVSWTAYNAGRFGLADQAAHHALALGTRDPRLLYHAGMAALGVGDRARARTLLDRALRLNPWFDPLQAPRARAALVEASR